MNLISRQLRWFVLLILGLFMVAGCRLNQTPSAAQLPQTPATAVAATSAAQRESKTNVPPTPRLAVRIKAGSSSAVTDSQGHGWLADQGFSGGDNVERPDLVITNTPQPEIYRSEHYTMDSFSWALANGNYVAKLHFCESFDGITGPGQRIFSFNVQGHEFKDMDVWAKAGGPNRAYIESVPVAITNGVFQIVFTSNIENPQINAIEIVPQP